MTTSTSTPDEVDEYIERLRYELRHARKRDRDDYLAQITDHLNESRVLLDADDPAVVHDLLNRMGTPFDLAKEFYAAERTKLNVAQRVLRWLRRWWLGVVALVIIAGFALVVEWAANYQPLSMNINGSYRDSVATLSGHPAVKLSEGPVQPITWKLTEGRYRVSILFTASNTGSRSVTISPPDLISGWGLVSKWQLENVRTNALTPFRSVVIPGQGYQFIVFTHTFTCRSWPKGNPNGSSGGETAYVTNLPIVMSYWGNQHTLQLAVRPFYLHFVGDCFP